VASGVPEPAAAGSAAFAFRSENPIRYAGLAVAKLSPIEAKDLAAPIPVRILAAPRLAGRARALAPAIGDILRLYTELVGPDPYPYLTAAFVETRLPAGHSPAYLCLLGEPARWNQARAEDDPAYFREEPVFSLAHELAHQWWGQGVGWRNYREQWLSEGLAQYFAALAVRRLRGEEAFART